MVCGLAGRRGERAKPLRALPVLVALALASPSAALAQNAAAPAAAIPLVAAGSQPVSTSVVINLIRLLVQQGVLTEDKADALIRQAEDEATQAMRAQQAAGAPPAASHATAAAPPPGPPAEPSSVHVTYVPQIVRQQIADQVKQEVMQQAKDENWAAPDSLPEWTKRFHPFGDFRLRYEWDFFDPRNANSFINFGSINSGSPVDISNVSNLPFLDTTSDRQRLRLRVRAGMTVDVTDGVTAGLRLATGNTTNPVSTNQTLGTDLNKDNFLLDLAYLRYQPEQWLSLWAGRMPNPWFSTDLVWSNELAFDGIAAQFAPQNKTGLVPFATAGLFPIENTDYNFPDNSLTKNNSRNKWLYAAQVGLDWRPSQDYEVKAGVAYYDFDKIQGQLSSPCNASAANIPCNTDDSRPGDLQQGNTLFALRNLDVTNGTEFQYFGLAAPFREVDVTTHVDYAHFDPVHIGLDGDFVTNIAVKANSIAALSPVNNLGPAPCANTANPACIGPWAGGGNGYMARLEVGHPEINERGDWNVFTAYKYLESDSVVDAFTDSDFHLGGTNAKGYIFGANLGVAHNIYVTGRWLSAHEISGPPYSVDVLQFDLNARY